MQISNLLNRCAMSFVYIIVRIPSIFTFQCHRSFLTKVVPAVSKSDPKGHGRNKIHRDYAGFLFACFI